MKQTILFIVLLVAPFLFLSGVAVPPWTAAVA